MKLLHSMVFSVCLMLCCNAYAQTLIATYKTKLPVSYNDGMGISIPVIDLEFTAVYCEIGTRSLFYKKPDYLNIYPDGTARLPKNEENKVEFVTFCIDTMQGVVYLNQDSLFQKTWFDCIPKGEGVDTINMRYYEPGYQIWEIDTATRNISGLSCQKASWKGSKSKVKQWEVWFAPSIRTISGPNGIVGLPGLVVEGVNLVSGEKYRLDKFEILPEKNENLLLPNMFKKPTRLLRPFRVFKN